jgi:hypothetical protein
MNLKISPEIMLNKFMKTNNFNFLKILPTIRKYMKFKQLLQLNFIKLKILILEMNSISILLQLQNKYRTKTK